MTEEKRKQLASQSSAAKWSTRSIMILMIAVNICLVVAMISCIIVYTTQNEDKSYEQNINNITNIASSQTELAQTTLNNSGTTVSSIANYCNGKSVDEAMQFMNTIIGDTKEEYQLLTITEINAVETHIGGFSTDKDEDGNFKEMDYSSGSSASLVDGLINSNLAMGQIAFMTEFTSRTNGIKSYASYCSLTLDVNGVDTTYYLLNPKTATSLLKTIKNNTQYPDLTIAICANNGDYLAAEAGFKSLNFYKYLYDFNGLTLDESNGIKSTVLKDEDGLGLLFYKDAKQRDCTFAYSRFTGETDWMVVICVPNIDFTSTELLPTFPMVIIIVLLVLLVFDMGALLKIIKKLRISVINERYANQAKTDFLSRMSHDMRTPLNSIINFSEFIGASTELTEAKDYADKVNNAGKYLLTLINDTLSMSRIEAGHLFINPEPMTFNDFEEGLISILGDKAEKKGIEFKIYSENDQNATLLLDPLRIQQVFVNLLNNAIKFTPEGGKVELRVSALGTVDNTQTVKFEVIDTGRGMSKEFVEDKLFKPFSQENNHGQDTEDSGTGLGLSIAKSVVEQMGGTITCSSELNQGTIFTVIIPAVVVSFSDNKAESGKNELPQDNTVILKGTHILVCEDNYLNKEIAVHLLSKVGCIVDTADNGQIGVELFAKSDLYHYAAVLMDKRMPVMDGLEATRRIRSLARSDAKDVPIIALSADVFDEHIEKGLLSGMTAYLSKPIDPKALYKELCLRISKERGAGNPQ